MQNVIYLDNFKKDKNFLKSNLTQLQCTLDSMGNNLMAMMWLTKLAHMELQDSGSQELAKKHLQNALTAGESAKKLLREVLDCQGHQDL